MADILPFFQRDTPFVISKEQLLTEEAEALLPRVLSRAKEKARPEISEFRVAALAVGYSGRGYLGVNIEFLGLPLSQTIHAEQFALSLARHYGEKSVTALYVTEMPCGHCRQFCTELGTPDMPITVFHDAQRTPYTLEGLLPVPFSLASPQFNPFHPEVTPCIPTEAEGDPLIQLAFNAAERGYVPYTKQPSSVAIELGHDHKFIGRPWESAAYNPTLPPFQDALIALIANNHQYEEITRVVLVEAEEPLITYAESITSWLEGHCESVTFETVYYKTDFEQTV